MIDTVRRDTAGFWSRGKDNLGLLFDRGLIKRAEQGQQVGEGGTEEARLIGRVAGLRAPDAYCRAYERWFEITNDSVSFARWIGRVDGRLILGAGSPHVLEAALTFSRPYGVPTIPGSSLKGIARAFVRDAGRLDQDTSNILFGWAPSADGNNMGDGGYLVFHDAWWVPDSAPTPCAAEVVTVHHPEYYRSYGRTPATDFDGPIPCPQLAARGSFLFAVEGVQPWADFGLKCLRAALENKGVGGKAAAGYGYFIDEATLKDERLQRFCKNWNNKEIATRFGKDFKKTQQEFGSEFSRLLELLREERDQLIQSWASAEKNTAEGKAYRKLMKGE